MQDPDGGYYATLDADSEGVEGKFYLWTPDDFAAALETDENQLAAQRFGLTQPPNFENHAWHLVAATPVESLTSSASQAAVTEVLDAARAKLLTVRSTRVWPGRDEKVIGAWNGLMIGAMAKAARTLERTDLLESAERALAFLERELWSDGRLRATFMRGEARHAAYLDDYAVLAHGILELLRTRWNTAHLTFATQLADTLLDQFEDDNGGFFFTAHDHEALIHRPKPFADEAVPAGNGIAAQVLLALGHLLGEPRYLEAAERTLKAAWPALKDYPHAHGALLKALTATLEPHTIIVVRGPAPEIGEWQRFLNAGYHPDRLTFAIGDDIGDLPGLLAERRPTGATVAYLCRGTTCEAPTDSLELLASRLGPPTQPA
jgi:uncharacterized protein YyaL (SSP411 family)